MSMSFDPEVPAGYQDADIEMRELAEAADSYNDDYCECGEEKMVTVGPDKVPLCITHFSQWLADQ